VLDVEGGVQQHDDSVTMLASRHAMALSPWLPAMPLLCCCLHIFVCLFVCFVPGMVSLVLCQRQCLDHEVKSLKGGAKVNTGCC
jgi:hypothetical protein